MTQLIKCDWCGKTATNPYRGVPDAAREDAMTAYYEFIHISVEACDDADHGDLCSWSCLVNWSRQKYRFAKDDAARPDAVSVARVGTSDPVEAER